MSSNLTSSSKHIGQLLRDGLDLFERELADRMPPIDGIRTRPTHNAVLRYLDRDGTHASELARRSGLTRQALSLIVAELEQMGVVERRDDPNDKRAKVITYSERGRAGFDRSRAVIAAIDDDFRDAVGEDYDALRRGLEALSSLYAQASASATAM
jgi:DNA-binding MarR family transcriptional regulator